VARALRNGWPVSEAAVAFPPLAKIATALREVTETLAREVAVPTATAPPWGDFEWRIARAVATMQGISSLLQANLRWENTASWRLFLEEQRYHIAGRQQKIAQLLDRIHEQACRKGIALVALKGAALHAIGIYQAGERPMADIDLLIREADREATTQLLGACNFESTFVSWRDQLFEPRVKAASIGFGEHIDNPIKIELHTKIRERLPISETEITQFLYPRAPQAGINDYPSAVSLMMHLLLHAAGNMRAHALRLIQLHDIARLAARFATKDWEALLAARPNGQPLWWAVPPLMLAAEYCPPSIPPSVIAGLHRECPWLLAKRARHQSLTDVSWSNIRANALPGIEWSRTPQEAFGFLISRIWPSRETRLELKRFAAYHTGGSEIPWYGISQPARILRWIFSKPPRVQTLLPVRAALAQPSDISSRTNGQHN
jgi:Uncharacterised nucleotidyltransferase